MTQVGMEFGTFLGRFLLDFGAKLGRKLGSSCNPNPLKSENMGYRKIIQKLARKSPCGGPLVAAPGPPVWSLEIN